MQHKNLNNKNLTNAKDSMTLGYENFRFNLIALGTCPRPEINNTTAKI